MADNIYGTTNRETGDSTHGQNTVVHYYDKAGVKAANAISVYAQWADRRSMPLKMGTTYKVSKWLHIFDRETAAGDFATKGYLTARSITDVTAGLAGATISEGAGVQNKQTIKKVTIETNFARYGEMLDYTDEVDMFAEDMVQVQYREELGLLANRRAEDLIQLDMLATTTVMYPGTASSLSTVGVDVTAADGTEDDLAKVSYDLMRKTVRKLVRNRAMKNTSIVMGSTKIDTRTINKAFYAIVGPEVKFDLENLTRGGSFETEFVYVPAYKYADASKLAEGEVGAMNDVRFYRLLLLTLLLLQLLIPSQVLLTMLIQKFVSIRSQSFYQLKALLLLLVLKVTVRLSLTLRLRLRLNCLTRTELLVSSATTCGMQV